MSFTTKYFSGVVTSGTGGNYTVGTFTAIISGDVNDVISGTWTYQGSYTADSSTGPNPYVLNGSGNISFSGTVTGASAESSGGRTAGGGLMRSSCCGPTRDARCSTCRARTR